MWLKVCNEHGYWLLTKDTASDLILPRFPGDQNSPGVNNWIALPLIVLITNLRTAVTYCVIKRKTKPCDKEICNQGIEWEQRLLLTAAGKVTIF